MAGKSIRGYVLAAATVVLLIGLTPTLSFADGHGHGGGSWHSHGGGWGGWHHGHDDHSSFSLSFWFGSFVPSYPSYSRVYYSSPPVYYGSYYYADPPVYVAAPPPPPPPAVVYYPARTYYYDYGCAPAPRSHVSVGVRYYYGH